MTFMPILAAAAVEATNTAASDNAFMQVARQFGLETRLFVSQLVLFVLVALVLAKFAYKPLLAMLEHRRHQIMEGIENAEKTRKELANAQAKSQEILAQANAQANKMIEEARAASAKVQEQESQKAVATAEQIIAKAREAAAADHTRMLAELKREVVRLVVQTTVTVTGKVLTADDQKRLADEAAKQLAAK